MKPDSDEELLARFLSGSVDAFESLVRRYEKPLVRFLLRYTKDYGLAEEVFQEAFVRVYRKAASFQEGRKFKTWAYTIALNLARTETAKIRNRPRMLDLDAVPARGRDDAAPLGALLPSGGTAPAEQVELKEAGELIRAAVDALPVRQREVFVLCHYEHMSYEEISGTLGRPVGTVKSQMHYALKALRVKLEHAGL